MAKRREEDSTSRWSRFLRWLREGDDSLDREMVRSLERQAEKTAVRRESAPAARPVPVRAARARAEKKRSRERFSRALYVAVTLLLCFGIIGLLLTTTAALPSFGSADNPANNEVPARYIERGLQETGSVNIVTGMILDYRAFDTLGESNVLFVAACTVIILLRLLQGEGEERLAAEADDRYFEPRNDVVLQTAARILTPLILMFGCYIVLNGHLSPGGGFSGGAVMGAGLILYLAAFGFAQTERFFTYRTFRAVSVSALTFYALSKAWSFFTGANGLPSFIGPGTPGRIFSAGLIPYLNIAVGLVVCCTMYAFFTLFRKGDL